MARGRPDQSHGGGLRYACPPFELRVWARVPSTGNLLRWLLGAGDNLEVVAPADLRGKVAAQAAKAAAIYAGAGGDA